MVVLIFQASKENSFPRLFFWNDGELSSALPKCRRYRLSHQFKPLWRLGTLSCSWLHLQSMQRQKLRPAVLLGWSAPERGKGHRPGKPEKRNLYPVISLSCCMTLSSPLKSPELRFSRLQSGDLFYPTGLLRDNVWHASREMRPTWVQILALQFLYSKETSHWNFLSLHFLICKSGIRYLPQHIVRKLKWDNMHAKQLA